jgi:hypothetical protein
MTIIKSILIEYLMFKFYLFNFVLIRIEFKFINEINNIFKSELLLFSNELDLIYKLIK